MRGLLILLFSCGMAFGQEGRLEQSLELEAAAGGAEEDAAQDQLLQELRHYLRHPLRINYCTEEELAGLNLVSALQVQQFMQYRRQFGRLLSLFELQAIPGWDLETIRGILPYISLAAPPELYRNFRSRLHSGVQGLLLRTVLSPQLPGGYRARDSSGPAYPGSATRAFLRYSYNYRNLLQYGISAEKDAGEQFFRGAQRYGFDFYSFPGSCPNAGSGRRASRHQKIRALALGDYSLSLGQGLIHWQGQGMRKNADAMLTRRQGEKLRPYRSAGEYNFMRGAALQWRMNAFEALVFASSRKLTANLDRGAAGIEVRSLQTSGYHRTVLEAGRRQNLDWQSAGLSLSVGVRGLRVGLNLIGHRFSHPFTVQPAPYDVHGFRGSFLGNASLDYQYTWRNLHLYGELAADHDRYVALINGLLVNLHRELDLALVWRRLDPRFRSFAGSSFTESGTPGNESGLYLGLNWRPEKRWLISGWVDYFRFPWLRYQVDGPGAGEGWLLQVRHQPDKETEIYARASGEIRIRNRVQAGDPAALTAGFRRADFRVHVSRQLDKYWIFRSRLQVSRTGWTDRDSSSNGFLCYADISGKWPRTGLSAGMRLQYYDAEDYDTRIYAFENGPLYDLSIPGFFDAGWRAYLNLHWGRSLGRKRKKELDAYVKTGMFWLSRGDGFGSGNDKVEGSRRNDLRVQLILGW